MGSGRQGPRADREKAFEAEFDDWIAAQNAHIKAHGTSIWWNTADASKLSVLCPAFDNWGNENAVLSQAPNIKIFRVIDARTVTCTLTASNDAGLSTTKVISTTFRMPPPPSLYIAWEPSSIVENQQGTFHFRPNNSVYTGVVCGGPVYNGGWALANPNQEQWWSDTFSTAGTQHCGVQVINPIGQTISYDAWMEIHAQATGNFGGGGSAPAPPIELVPIDSGGDCGCGGTGGACD